MVLFAKLFGGNWSPSKQFGKHLPPITIRRYTIHTKYNQTTIEVSGLSGKFIFPGSVARSSGQVARPSGSWHVKKSCVFAFPANFLDKHFHLSSEDVLITIPLLEVVC